jgi:protein-disulfide isomerase
MASKNRNRRLSLDGSTPSGDRNTARQPRQTGPESKRKLSRAGTRGPSDGRGSLLLWSMAFVVVAVVVVGVTLIVAGAKNNAPSGPVTAPTVVTPANIVSSGRTLGNPNARVTIDIYGDFRCSACLVFTTGGTEQNLVANYVATNKVKLVWHDYLSIDKGQGGTASRDAANAAWCAADQGKFWVMHDWLYANNGSGSEDPAAFTYARLTDIGRAAGLDMSAYDGCLKGGQHNGDITAEDQATPADVTGTPAIYLNGALLTGGTPNSWPQYPQLKAAIDALG